MLLETHKIVFYLGILHHVEAGKGIQRCHAEKAEVHVHGEQQVVDALALEQVFLWIVEGFLRGIESM